MIYRRPTSYKMTHKPDVRRIAEAFHAFGHQINFSSAVFAWEQYSFDNCANWMTLPEDDDTIVEICKRYLEGVSSSNTEDTRR